MIDRRQRGVQTARQVHNAFDRGVAKIVASVRPTLGPTPRLVAVDRGAADRAPELLDSAAVIARRIVELDHPGEDVGAMYLRGLLWRVHDEVGDGAATAAVLFGALLAGARRFIAAGVPATPLRGAMVRAGELARAELLRQSIETTSPALLAGVIASACEDHEIACGLAAAFGVLPHYGRLDVRLSHRRETRHELVEGAYWDVGAHSIALLNQPAPTRVDLVEPTIVVSDFAIEDPADAIAILERAQAAGRSRLLVVCRSLSDRAAGVFHTNRHSSVGPVVAVRIPGLSQDDQREALTDLAILTGARFLRSAAGDGPSSLSADAFGYARTAWVTRDQFGLVRRGGGDPRTLRRHVDELLAIVDGAADRDTRRRALTRLGTFGGGSATLWVGSATEAETKRRVSVAERGALVARQALAHGVVPGGGAALLGCQPALMARLETASDDVERAAMRILHDALEAPAAAMLANAGLTPGPIIDEVRRRGWPYGVDITGGTVADLFARGIVDSIAVLDRMLIATVESAALATTIDAIVHTAKREISVDPEGRER